MKKASKWPRYFAPLLRLGLLLGFLGPMSAGRELQTSSVLPVERWEVNWPEVKSLEVLHGAGMGVAHLTLLVPQATNQRTVLQKVVGSVKLLNTLEPRLDEVDVTVQGKPEAADRLPLFTASIPRSRWTEFQQDALTPEVPRYDRWWWKGKLPIRPLPTEQPPLNPISAWDQGWSDWSGRLKRKLGLMPPLSSLGVVHGGSAFSHKAALTFDDGPHPMYDPVLLGLLKKNHVRATFFLVGEKAQAYPYFVRDMVRAGHEVGNHTFDHLHLPQLTLSEVTAEVKLNTRLLQLLVQRPIHWFRPPGGKFTRDVLEVVHQQGLQTVLWTNAPGDTLGLGGQTLLDRLDRFLKPGAIVLLHDNASMDLVQLPAFFQLAQRRQIQLTTVGDLLEKPGVHPVER